MSSRIILITGAQRGLGFATGRKLIALGHCVVLTGRDPGRMESAARALGAEWLTLDVLSDASLAAAARVIEQRHGRLDSLVNNAAVLLDGTAEVRELGRDVFLETLRTNTVAPLAVVQSMLRLLKNSDSPRIVNVSSGAGQLGDGKLQTWAPAYAASKSALNAITQQLASALPAFAVNSVCPGWCRTEMGGSDAPRSPDEGADTIAWLAAEAPQSLTGQFLRDRNPIPW